ncbi:MAG: hypothetical protein ACK5P4_00395 [Bacteroidota bacterium]
MMLDISKFISVAKEQKTGERTTKTATDYIRENKTKYNDLNIEISFGAGRASEIPWIAIINLFRLVNRKGISNNVVAYITVDGHYYIYQDKKQNLSIAASIASRINSFLADNFCIGIGKAAQ